jgi:hypothetical protein
MITKKILQQLMIQNTFLINNANNFKVINFLNKINN